jgi:heme-degrading monooxygenase HmoA
MFVRSTATHVALANLEAAMAFVRDRSLPQCQTAPGFKHFLSLVDRQSGNTIVLSFWGSEADMRAAEELGSQVRAEAIGAIQADPPKVERYEVFIEEHSHAPAGSGPAAVRVITTRAEPGNTEQAVQYLRERVVPQLHLRKGFRSYYVMVDRQTGNSRTLVIYDSRADLKAAEAAADASNAQIARDMQLGPLNVSNYEVAIRA